MDEGPANGNCNGVVSEDEASLRSASVKYLKKFVASYGITFPGKQRISFVPYTISQTFGLYRDLKISLFSQNIRQFIIYYGRQSQEERIARKRKRHVEVHLFKV